MIKCLILVAVSLSLSGCFAGYKTKKAWHMASIPPSAARELVAQCDVAHQVGAMIPGITADLLKYEQHKRKEAEAKVEALQMENAALRAANQHLLDGRK